MNDGIDARVARTQAALRSSFNRLLLAHGYEAIRPGAIARGAGVARSTFYEHFDDKAALLRHALTAVLQPLARAFRDTCVEPQLQTVVDHFRDNRRLANALLASGARLLVECRLAELVEAELRAVSAAAMVPLPLVAAQLAHGQLGLIERWLRGGTPCSAADIAHALHASACATTQALLTFRSGRVS